jgi:hypothetical protein
MTRWEVERRIALLLGENPDNPGFGEPIWLREATIDAVSYVTRFADLYESFFTYDLDGTSGTPRQRFCLPDRLYKLKEVRVSDPQGRWKTFRAGNGLVTERAAAAYDATWRTTTRSSAVELVVYAAPDLYLYPPATYTLTAGVVAHGYAVYPRSWSESTPDADPARGDVFPLPAWALEAVTYYAASLRCIQFPTPDNRLRYQMLDDRARAELGRVVQAGAGSRGKL